MPSQPLLLAFVIASVVIVLIPGPSLLFTIGRAISAGRREALLSVVGNMLGLLTQIVAIAAGLGPVVAASATAYTVLKVLGGGYLVWLGIRAIRDRREVTAAMAAGLPTSGPVGHAIRTGYLVGVTNPKTIVFFVALLPQFVNPATGPVWLQIVVLGAIFGVIGIISDGSFALAAGAARDWFARSPERMERIGGAGGLMMIGLGTGLLFAGRPE